MPEVVFLLVPKLHLLDLAGAAQVFSTAVDLLAEDGGTTRPTTCTSSPRTRKWRRPKAFRCGRRPDGPSSAPTTWS